jgi:SM-20-related protein
MNPQEKKWLNNKYITDAAINEYRSALTLQNPNYIVIDGLFNETMLDAVLETLQQPQHWQTQRHTYSELYVDDTQWQSADADQRFVQRDVWKPSKDTNTTASEFLTVLRSDEFMAVLSRIFNVHLTDIRVGDPGINTNYFRLNTDDLIEQHADDSPGREVCMLLYLNKDWTEDSGGELVFKGESDNSIRIAPLYNRCVLFDPASKGSEHWVEKVKAQSASVYRYNITSWYWGE